MTVETSLWCNTTDTISVLLAYILQEITRRRLGYPTAEGYEGEILTW